MRKAQAGRRCGKTGPNEKYGVSLSCGRLLRLIKNSRVSSHSFAQAVDQCFRRERVSYGDFEWLMRGQQGAEIVKIEVVTRIHADRGAFGGLGDFRVGSHLRRQRLRIVFPLLERLGKRSCVDLDPVDFHTSRFFDGAKIPGVHEQADARALRFELQHG